MAPPAVPQPRDEDDTVLALSGELDAFSAVDLQHTLQAHEGGGRLVIDLRDVSFLDTGGARALASYARGRDDVVLRGLRPLARQVFALTALDDEVRIS